VSILEKLKGRARVHRQRIVLPEGEDPRVIAAAAQICAQGFASVTLLGREKTVRDAAGRSGVNLNGAKLVDPAASPELDSYARILHERRRAHGLTLDEAHEMARRPLYFAALAVAAGDADGCVGGAANTTAESVRAALHSIGLAPQAKLLSSFFLMVLPARAEQEIEAAP
jgi:phosphate acetyltransferase